MLYLLPCLVLTTGCQHNTQNTNEEGPALEFRVALELRSETKIWEAANLFRKEIEKASPGDQTGNASGRFHPLCSQCRGQGQHCPDGALHFTLPAGNDYRTTAHHLRAADRYFFAFFDGVGI
jgi:hypothetical protein